MGVAGCGKSSLGREVAAALGLPLIEGDDFHLPASVAKMKAGVPLEDADRIGWLDELGRQLAAHPQGAVLTCSALRKAYRERLRAASAGLRFAHLALSRDESVRRVAARAAAHFFTPSLVDSQFAALESPAGEPGVLTLDATLPLPDLTVLVLDWLKGSPHA
ncbi:MAG TPA: gluconokinase [Ideonella sp.]|nr:gluconokinase [Ideonella sp.]